MRVKLPGQVPTIISDNAWPDVYARVLAVELIVLHSWASSPGYDRHQDKMQAKGTSLYFSRCLQLISALGACLGKPEDIRTTCDFIDLSNDESPPGTRVSLPELPLAWAQRALGSKDDASSDVEAEIDANVDNETPPPPPKKVCTSFQTNK
jgi:hypothetical protein